MRHERGSVPPLGATVSLLLLLLLPTLLGVLVSAPGHPPTLRHESMDAPTVLFLQRWAPLRLTSLLHTALDQAQRQGIAVPPLQGTANGTPGVLEDPWLQRLCVAAIGSVGGPPPSLQTEGWRLQVQLEQLRVHPQGAVDLTLELVASHPGRRGEPSQTARWQGHLLLEHPLLRQRMLEQQLRLAFGPLGPVPRLFEGLLSTSLAEGIGRNESPTTTVERTATRWTRDRLPGSLLPLLSGLPTTAQAADVPTTQGAWQAAALTREPTRGLEERALLRLALNAAIDRLGPQLLAYIGGDVVARWQQGCGCVLSGGTSLLLQHALEPMVDSLVDRLSTDLDAPDLRSGLAAHLETVAAALEGDVQRDPAAASEQGLWPWLGDPLRLWAVALLRSWASSPALSVSEELLQPPPRPPAGLVAVRSSGGSIAVTAQRCTILHHLQPLLPLRVLEQSLLDGAVDESTVQGLVRPFELRCVIDLAASLGTLTLEDRGGAPRQLPAMAPLRWQSVIVLPLGSPIAGVPMEADSSLLADLSAAGAGIVGAVARALGAFWQRLWSGAQQVAEALAAWLRQPFERAGDIGVVGLLHDLSRALRALIDGPDVAVDRSLRVLWRYIERVYGPSLRESTSFDLQLWGVPLQVRGDPLGQSVSVCLGTVDVQLCVRLQHLVANERPWVSMPVEGHRIALVLSALVHRGESTVRVVVDPLRAIEPAMVHVRLQTHPRAGGWVIDLQLVGSRTAPRTESVSLSQLLHVPLPALPIPGTPLFLRPDVALSVEVDARGILRPWRVLLGRLEDAWSAQLRGLDLQALGRRLAIPDDGAALLQRLLAATFAGLLEGGDLLVQAVSIRLDLTIEGPTGLAGARTSIALRLREPPSAMFHLCGWFASLLRAAPLAGGAPSGGSLPQPVLARLGLRIATELEVGAITSLPLPGMHLGATRLSIAQAQLDVNIGAFGQLLGRQWGGADLQASLVLPSLSRSAARALGLHQLPTRATAVDVLVASLRVRSQPVAPVVISEVAYDTDQDLRKEFIELSNRGGRALDLSGWQLRDSDRGWSLPVGSVLPAHGVVVLGTSSAVPLGEERRLPDIAGVTLRLDDGGDSLTLVDPLGVEQDHVAWEGFEVGWDQRATQGRSIHRWEGEDHDDGRDWYSAVPTPGVAVGS